MTKSWSFTTGRASVAVVICGVLLGACGGTGRHAAGQSVPSAQTATAPITTSRDSASPSAPAGPKPGSRPLSSTISAIAEPVVTFTGEQVRVFAQVSSSVPVPLVIGRVVIARVDFGDGSGIITFLARACHLDPVQQLNLVNSPVVSHRYALPGQHTIRIWAKLGCGTDQSVQYRGSSCSAPAARPCPPPRAGADRSCFLRSARTW